MQGVGFVVADALAMAHLAVEVKERRTVSLAPEQPLTDEDQVVVRLPGAARQEERLAEPIHELPSGRKTKDGRRKTETLARLSSVLRPSPFVARRGRRHGLAEALCQIRVPSRPVEH